MTGFPSALGVVRVHLRYGQVVATLPHPIAKARDLLDELVAEIAGEADATGLVGFSTDITASTPDMWIRARDVVLVDLVPTEDPGAGS